MRLAKRNNSQKKLTVHKTLQIRKRFKK